VRSLGRDYNCPIFLSEPIYQIHKSLDPAHEARPAPTWAGPAVAEEQVVMVMSELEVEGEG
jgi:hypothetical protein